jgi:predicted enzyme related to lactoylglutathione lyase
MAPSDFPPVGRGATLADPTGAVFSIWKSVEGDAPELDPVPVGHWYWNELSTSDASKALAFYESVFGYTHDAMDMGPQGNYYMLKQGERMCGGLMKSPMPEMPAMWLPYVLVANCDASLTKALKLGAKQCLGATDIPNVGRFAVVNDPTGAMIAFMSKA